MKRPEKYVWFDDERARLVIEFFRGRAYVHLKIRKWGMDVVREARTRWPEIRSALQGCGYPTVYTYNNVSDADPKWMRFAALFGFAEKARRNGVVVMEATSA